MKIISRFPSSIIVINVVLYVFVDSFIDVKMMKAFFKEKNTHRSYIVVCLKKVERMHLLKSLVFDHQAMSVLNINDTSSTRFMKTDHTHIGVILDGDCNTGKVETFLKKCGSNKFFDVQHHWLIMSSNESFSDLLKNVELNMDADIYVAFPLNNTDKHVIEDVYNPAHGKGGELKKRILGYYSQDDGFQARDSESKYWLRKNMTGVTLKSHIVLPVPFNGQLIDYLNSESHREINTFNRFHYSLMSSCVSYYNFTPDISLTKSWGYLTKNGSFDGLVGSLGNHTVDYGSSPLFVRTDRATVMEYGRRTWILRAAFVFRNPKSRNSFDVFIKPLSLSIWLLTLFSSLFVILLLRLAYLYEKRNVDRYTDTTWSYFVLCTVGAFCQQGMIVTPFSYSGRIIILSLLILSLMIYQFYSASLVSRLLMKPDTRIKSVEDILKSDMKVGCEDTLYNRDYFLYTTDKPSRLLYNRKILKKKNTSNFLEPQDGLVLVKNGGYAFHVELATAYPIIQESFPDKSICQLSEVQMYRTQPMHANYQKYSPFRNMFDTCLQHLAEYGIMHRELTFWHPKKPECIESRSISYDIGLDYFYPAFIFLAIGMVLSLIMLISEIAANFKQKTDTSTKEIIPIRSFVQ